MDRLAKKMAIINGEVVEEEKPVKKKATVKKLYLVIRVRYIIYKMVLRFLKSKKFK